MFRKITEGMTSVLVPEEAKVSKKLPVFYNPVMGFNRDMSVLLLNVLGKKDIKVGDPLAGTGIRGIRLLKELPPEAISMVWMNDYNPRFIPLVKESLSLNDVKQEDTLASSFFDRRQKMRTTSVFQRDVLESGFTAYNKRVLLSSIDANLFLFLSPGFDYIDIDPFGSPNPFLDAACMRLAREGILAMTATDTSTLCGTYRNACIRKYWAIPVHNELMHEVGLRILIRKVQLVASQYDKALIPIFSYSRDHYMRIFFSCRKGKGEVDNIVKQHATFAFGGLTGGPLWTGQLWDLALVRKMHDLETDSGNKRFLAIIADEARIPTVGFFDIHAMCKRHGIKIMPRTEEITDRLRKSGKRWSFTHFSPTGIRTEATGEEFLRALQ